LIWSPVGTCLAADFEAEPPLEMYSASRTLPILALVLPGSLHAQTDQTATEKAAAQIIVDEPPKVTGVQVRVLDGDTIVVGSTRYRLLGIDAPERFSFAFVRAASTPAVTTLPGTYAI
jgi:endonuclease YncB( thermonuclease family)